MTATAAGGVRPGPEAGGPVPQDGGPDAVLPLAAEFESSGRGAWLELAAAVLNKSRPDDDRLSARQVRRKLSTRLRGGLAVEALYLPEDAPAPLGYPGSMPFTRGIGPRHRAVPWCVRQLHDHPDPVVTGRAILDDLERGTTSLWLDVGPDAVRADDVPAVLDGVLLDVAPVVVSSSTDQRAAAAALTGVWRRSGIDPGRVRGCLGIDPVGLAAVRGTAPDLSWLAETARRGRAEFALVRPLVVDTRPYHDAGGSEVDEIGCAVATGIAYLRALQEAGIPCASAFSLVEFRVTASADQFLTIASLRALRRLWARVGDVAGVPERDRGAHLHAVTSWRMMTRDDPWVNILRTTLACVGASVGGAQTITVLPFDTACGLPDALSRRIARNTQILLAEESHLAAVADPAGGSWYVESLTDQLASSSWAWVQELERHGGIVAALGSGLLRDRLASTREELDRALARRTLPLTGVSSFPPVGEEPLRRAARPYPVPSGGLPRRRDAEVFERLRDRSRRADGAGTSPTVFLATLGTRRDFSARLTFTSSLLAVAGITTVVSTGSEPEAIAAQAVTASPVTVLCSSRRGYAEYGPATIEALRGAGVRHVYLAGRATELGDAADRVDATVFDGMDVLAFLTGLLDLLESSR
jgi:methylmalonyl-CoA mutase